VAGFCEYGNEQRGICVSHIKIIIARDVTPYSLVQSNVSRPDLWDVSEGKRYRGSGCSIIMGGRVTHVITHTMPTISELADSFESTARSVEDGQV
jgi:hypothetical protein